MVPVPLVPWFRLYVAKFMARATSRSSQPPVMELVPSVTVPLYSLLPVPLAAAVRSVSHFARMAPECASRR